MPMTRVLLAVCCALLTAWVSVSEAQQLPRGPGPGSRFPESRAPGGGQPAQCPAFPARCQVNAPSFNFGRQTMNVDTPPINGTALISVTCTRHPQDRLSVEVPFDLMAVMPDAPPRYMRDQHLAYLAYDMYVDPARTRLWGDGSSGTEVLEGGCILNEKNRVCTIPFTIYGRVDGAQTATPPGQYLGAVIARVHYRFVACIP